MRILTTFFIALLIFIAGPSPVSAQTNFAAQVADSIRSVVDTFTGDKTHERIEEKARTFQNQAEERSVSTEHSTQSNSFRAPENPCRNLQKDECAKNPRCEPVTGPSECIGNECTTDEAYKGCRLNDPQTTDKKYINPRTNMSKNEHDLRGSRVRDAFDRATQATTSADHRALLERIKQKREEHRAEIKEHVAEIHRERIHAFAERMLDRLQAAIYRLSTLANRIDSRIDRFEEAGVDTSEAQQTLSNARADITAAQNHLDEADAIFEDIKEGDIDPRDIFTDAKELMHEMTGLIKDAHASLVEVIRTLKATLDDNIPPETDSDDELEENENETEENEPGDNANENQDDTETQN